MTEPMKLVPTWLNQVKQNIHIYAIRFYLDTRNEEISIPMLRGVWGAVLHDAYLNIYQSLFDPAESENTVPRYILRPALKNIRPAPAFELILINSNKNELISAIQAWDIAFRLGVGKNRTHVTPLWRIPLGPPHKPIFSYFDGFSADGIDGQIPSDTPSEMCFVTPLRIKRDQQVLLTPTIQDVAIQFARRLNLISFGTDKVDRAIQNELLSVCDSLNTSDWQGDVTKFKRYSVSQKKELHLQGTVGSIYFPNGMGALSEFLQLTEWLHVGKSTIMGLGRTRFRIVEQ